MIIMHQLDTGAKISLSSSDIANQGMVQTLTVNIDVSVAVKMLIVKLLSQYKEVQYQNQLKH